MFHVKHAKRDSLTRKIRKGCKRRDISLRAVRHGDLDEAWWLAAPQIPLMPQKAWRGSGTHNI
jgi:hypothetical protein